MIIKTINKNNETRYYKAKEVVKNELQVVFYDIENPYNPMTNLAFSDYRNIYLMNDNGATIEKLL